MARARFVEGEAAGAVGGRKREEWSPSLPTTGVVRRRRPAGMNAG